MKTKIQNGGRILTREIENHRTGDAKKTLEQEKRESDQRNGLGKRSMQGCNGDGQGAGKQGLCDWNNKRKIRRIGQDLVIPLAVPQTSTTDGKTGSQCPSKHSQSCREEAPGISCSAPDLLAAFSTTSKTETCSIALSQLLKFREGGKKSPWRHLLLRNSFVANSAWRWLFTPLTWRWLRLGP